jgi:PAS domain-containing protein
VHPDDRERVRAIDSTLDETGGFEIEYRIFHKDGSVRWVPRPVLAC